MYLTKNLIRASKKMTSIIQRKVTTLLILGVQQGCPTSTHDYANDNHAHNSIPCSRSGMNDSIAGIHPSATLAHTQVPSIVNRYTVQILGQLHDSRCYTDAPTDPISSLPRKARIGNFYYQHVHLPQHVYIKATMLDSTSVLMAEAAALAEAAIVTERLHPQYTNFKIIKSWYFFYISQTTHTLQNGESSTSLSSSSTTQSKEA